MKLSVPGRVTATAVVATVSLLAGGSIAGAAPAGPVDAVIAMSTLTASSPANTPRALRIALCLSPAVNPGNALEQNRDR